ncbi:HPP family protein [Methanococcus voltae]|uniref:CBS domain containing protein n=1 Tax=Methanococcus voltae (strain ATCC BAA-1334 / A3) TaxID=456320 RepID=D7DQY3_METV3|nr:CBS domain-containing protein [Methanococcus voltae]MCS3900920.1 putative transcriptional regulator [Methanococcus voltae]
MKVKALMDTKFIKVYPEDTVEVVSKIMHNRKKFSTPIIDRSDKLVGWVNSIDLLIVDDKKTLIKDVMHNLDTIIVLNKEEPAKNAVLKIVKHKVVSIPVLTDDGTLVGLVRNCDITKTLAKMYDIPVYKIFKSLNSELKGISWDELMDSAAIVTKQITGENITGKEYESRIKKSTFGQAIWSCGGLERFFTGLIKIGEIAVARKVSHKSIVRK